MSQTLFLLYRPEPTRPMLKTRSVGAEPPRRGRCPACSFLPLSKTTSVGAHSICARGSLPYRKRARADMESAPTFLKGRTPPAQRAVPSVEVSSFVESEICRGAFYMRPRKFVLPQAGTGGYGIRPYVFCGGRCPPPHRGGQGARFCLLCVQADLFPLSPCQKPSYVVYYFSTSPQANPVQTGDAKL